MADVRTQEDFTELYTAYDAANEKTLTGIGPVGLHYALALLLRDKYGIEHQDRTQCVLSARRLLNEYLEKIGHRKRVK